jgi:tRNA splicing endonuclease
LGRASNQHSHTRGLEMTTTGGGAWVNDLATASALRKDRLLTSSLRFEPSFKHEEVDDPDFDPESFVRHAETKKARKAANFKFEQLLPLPLSRDETRLALALGKIKMTQNNTAVLCHEETTSSTTARSEEDERMAVFREMHSFGWTMVDGLKFGAHFLAYAGDPLLTHADLMVLIVPADEMRTPMLDATLLTTVAAKTRKSLVFASRMEDGKVVFTKLGRQAVNLPRFGGRGAPTAEDRLLDEVPETVDEIRVEDPV